MNALLLVLWLAGLVQIAIASANCFLPRKLKYQENLELVAPIIRQIFVVHSVYIVGVLLLFAALTLGFAPELASGHGLGRFLGRGLRFSGCFALLYNCFITMLPCGARIGWGTSRLRRPRCF